MTGLGRMVVADRVPPVNGAAPCTADDATIALSDDCHESAALDGVPRRRGVGDRRCNGCWPAR